MMPELVGCRKLWASLAELPFLALELHFSSLSDGVILLREQGEEQPSK